MNFQVFMQIRSLLFINMQIIWMQKYTVSDAIMLYHHTKFEVDA